MRYLVLLILILFPVLSPAQEIRELAVIEMNEAFGVHLRENIACVSNGFDGIVLVDVTDPENPEVVSTLDTPGHNLDARLNGDFVFATDGNRGLQIIDIADLENPELVANVELNGFSRRVRVRDDIAYIVSYNGGLHLVDVSDPPQPEILNNIDGIGHARAIILEENLAYIASSREGLQIIDISNPMNLQVVGTGDTPGNAIGIDLQGRHTFVADFSGGVRIFNCQNPQQPFEVGFIDTTDYTYDVVVDDNLAFIAEWEDGFRLVDISDLEQPRDVALVNTPGFTASLAYRNGYLYACDYEGGFRIYDVSDFIGNPRIQVLPDHLPFFHVNLGDTATRSITIQDTGSQNLIIRDIVVTGDYFESGFEEEIVIESGQSQQVSITFFPGHEGEFEGEVLIESNDPDAEFTSISLTGTGREQVIRSLGTLYRNSHPRHAVRYGDYLYIADFREGLVVFDVSDILEPEMVSRLDLDGRPSKLDIQQNQLIAAVSEGGMYVLSLDDPVNPQVIAQFDTPNLAKSFDIENDYAFIADNDAGLVIAEIFGIDQPEITGSLEMPGRCLDVCVRDETVWAANEIHGVRKIDVSDLENPAVEDLFFTGGDVLAVDEFEGVVYAANSSQGVAAIIEHPDENAFDVRMSFYEGNCVDICVHDTLLFAVWEEGVMRVLDISNPNDNPDYLRDIAVIEYPPRGKTISVENAIAYVSADTSGVHMFDLSEIIETGVQPTEVITPLTCVLLNSYPNPFNNSVSVEYTLPVPSPVDLCIYDQSGKFITRLQKGYVAPGTYISKWQANSSVSGIYFIELRCEKSVYYKKAVLVR